MTLRNIKTNPQTGKIYAYEADGGNSIETAELVPFKPTDAIIRGVKYNPGDTMVRLFFTYKETIYKEVSDNSKKRKKVTIFKWYEVQEQYSGMFAAALAAAAAAATKSTCALINKRYPLENVA